MGDRRPVRLMGVINLSRESFYQGSVAGPEEALSLARAMQEQGADIIDVGAVSTAPGSPAISEELERRRLFPALGDILDSLDITVSVDTQRPAIAADALSRGAHCINDVSGLCRPQMASTVAEHEGSLIIMASRKRAGDLLCLEEIIPLLGERMREAETAGVSPERIILDPGIGRWIPEKTAAHDLAILDGFKRLRCLGRPVVAALSRKTFIGECLHQPDPFQRLQGSLAATAIAVYLGAHIVRTHDVAASRETVALAEDGDLEVEVLDRLGGREDLAQILSRTAVDERGFGALSRKGSFCLLSLRGLSSMEAIIIKQEMLVRGGDAAVPKLALRCDPHPEEVIIMRSVHQIAGLVRNLASQPFRLSRLARLIDEALDRIDSPERYRWE
ncbi:MAG: dihydropteroate synthase [Methanosaeta sp. ASM2]|nr:MAG: dihydropteroate synthase [Methanosaeta sp. ASM2]